MATIDTCMIQKFVPRARQILKFPFDDKEFCPLSWGLQCFTSNGEKLLFLACFCFQASKAANIGRNKSIYIDLIQDHVSYTSQQAKLSAPHSLGAANERPQGRACFCVVCLFSYCTFSNKEQKDNVGGHHPACCNCPAWNGYSKRCQLYLVGAAPLRARCLSTGIAGASFRWREYTDAWRKRLQTPTLGVSALHYARGDSLNPPSQTVL